MFGSTTMQLSMPRPHEKSGKTDLTKRRSKEGKRTPREEIILRRKIKEVTSMVTLKREGASKKQ